MPRRNKTAGVRLLAQDERLIKALESVHTLRRDFGVLINTPPIADLRTLVQQGHDFYRKVNATPPWIGYLIIESGSNSVRGVCGFKGNPNPAGEVEISYFTFPDHQGRGIATASTRELVRIASAEPGLTQVLAHTLPEKNASGSVLTKAGFTRVGEVIDPEDGPVWRWVHPV